MPPCQTSTFARGAALGALIAAAVAYWTWRSGEDSNPNLIVPATVRAEPNAVVTPDRPANEMLYGASAIGRGMSRMGAGASGGAIDLNTGVLSGNSFHPHPR